MAVIYYTSLYYGKLEQLDIGTDDRLIKRNERGQRIRGQQSYLVFCRAG